MQGIMTSTTKTSPTSATMTMAQSCSSKCCRSKSGRSSGGIKRVATTMPLLASYLLIFTVVTSFVTSQPVTNLPTRNKLTTITTTAAATSSPSLSSPPSSSSPPLSSYSTGNENENTLTSSADVDVSKAFTSTAPHADFASVFPLIIPIEAATVAEAEEKKELNQLIPNEMPNQDEARMKQMYNKPKKNGNDDVFPEEEKGTGASIKMASEKLEGERRGMGRDKDKVMMTDDVRGSSSQIVNPSYLSSSSLSSQNDNSVEKNSASSHAFPEQALSSLHGNDGDGDGDGEESKVNRGTTAIEMNLNKSQRIMSTSKQDTTHSQSLDGNANNVFVNNHANFRQIRQNKQEEGQPNTTGTRGHHGDPNDASDKESYRGPKMTLFDKKKDGEESNLQYDSSTPQGNTSHLKSSRVAVLVEEPSTKVNSSVSTKFAVFTSPELSVNTNKKKSDKEQGSRRRVNKENKEEHQQVELPRHHLSLDDYLSDSPPPSSLTEEEENWSWNPPPAPSSPLLMNKWIKTVVKLSQCRATCLDQAALAHHRWDSIQSPARLVDFVGEEEADSDVRWKNHHLQEGTSGGATRAPSQLVPSSYTPISSDSLNDKKKQEKETMPVPVYLDHGQKRKEKKTVNVNRSNPLAPELPSSSGGAPSRTIKVTPSKSMKYYELSTCQESCRRKYPIQNGFHLVGDDDEGEGAMNYQLEGKDDDDGKTSGLSKAESLTTRNREMPGNTNNDENNSGNNNNNNENIETKQMSVKRKETADRKSNNNHEQQHYYYFASETQLGEAQFDEEKNQPPSNGRVVVEEEELVSSGVAVPKGEPEQAESKRNENIIRRNRSEGADPLMKLLAIEGTTQRAWKYNSASLNKLKTFPTEQGLKVHKVSWKNGESMKQRDGAASIASPNTPLSPSPTLFLQLTWPKPWSRDRVVENSNGNNNNRPEGRTTAQVKDKKGIVHHDHDVDKVEKENNKNEENEQERSQGLQEDNSSEPIIVYSIILEESWEKVRSDGTTDTYARWWKLIDQTVARTTAQISLPAAVPLPPEEKRKNNERQRQTSEQEVTAGALTQKRNKGNNKMDDQIIKERGAKKYSQRIMLAPLPPLFPSDDPPSKVTLRVLAVTGEKGLEKVYSTVLNNSYYHLTEHHNDHQHGRDERSNSEDEKHPNQPHEQHLHESRSENPNQVNVNATDSHNTSHPKFSNEKTGNHVGAESINRKVGEEKEKEVKVEKKVGFRGKELEATVDLDGSSNENSNQILAFPSKESLSRTMRKGLSGEMKVKNLMSRLKQKNINLKGKNQLITTFTDSSADSTNRTNVKLPEESNTIAPFAGDGVLAAEEEVESQNWGLHTVSMVYQKFLVVTQVTWDYPGNYDELDNSHETTLSIPETIEKSKSNTNGKNDTVALKLSLDNEVDVKHATTKKMARRSAATGKSKKWRGCGGGGGHHRSTADTRGKQDVEDAGEVDDSGKLNFLLSWEIFGGGLRGNLVTDTCSASISLWPDTVYIIQVGLITPANSSNTTTGNSGSTTFLTTTTVKYEETTEPFGSNEKTASFNKAADPLALIAEMDEDDVDEISTWKWKTDRTNNFPISAKNIPSPQAASETLQRNNPLISSSQPPGELEAKRQKGLVEATALQLPSSSSTSSSFDPLALPESIAFPFDGEPKVTIKSERILVNTTRVPPGSGGGDDDDDTSSSMRTATHNQDKMAQGTSQTNNNFPGKNKVNAKGFYYWKTKNGKQMGKNFDDATSSQNTASDPSSTGGSISDKVYVSPITITQNDDENQNGHVSRTSDQPEAAATTTADSSPEWEEDDEDETTDQDESLFARSLAHQQHHHHHQRRPPPLPQARTQPESEDVSKTVLEYGKGSQLPSNGRRFHNFLTVNSFYQSLYALSQNALELSNRYPNVITLGNGGSGKAAGGNGTSSTGGSGSDPKVILSDLNPANQTGGEFLYRGSNGDGDDASTFRGKLYTLFVILVISFVVFLFIVAIVGFCVLTSSIKENYKFFVPKKVRVWTTVGQLFKGASSSSSSGEGQSGGGFKDSAEGSFYPRRLQEEPDYEFDDDFDPDEDEEEEVTSVADTEEEDEEESECCDCNCMIENDSNSFSMNKRSSPCCSGSDTATLIRVGEESSVELMVASQSPPAAEIGGSCIRNSETSVGGGGGGHCCSSCGSCNGNCDSTNPCYHSLPGGKLQETPPTNSTSSKTRSVSAALSSLKKNFHLVPKQNNHHRHHHHHHHRHHKKKSDVRIDMSEGSSRCRGQTNPRQQGYF